MVSTFFSGHFGMPCYTKSNQIKNNDETIENLIDYFVVLNRYRVLIGGDQHVR